VLAAIVFTFSFNFSVLLTVMAERVFGGGAGAFGSLMSLMGVGSLLGALAMAGWGRPSVRRISLAGIAFGAATAFAALAPSLPVELVLLAAVGFTSMIFMAGTNSLLQLTSADAMRGRVMSLYGIVFLGTAPFGGPLTGWLAEVLGGRDTMLVGGLIAMTASAVALTTLGPATREPATRRVDVDREGSRRRATSPASSLGR